MFIRQFFQTQNGRRNASWALVESYRTASGPRQRIVAWLGKLDEAGRLGVRTAAELAEDSKASMRTPSDPLRLEFETGLDEADDRPVEPRCVAVNAHAVRVEHLPQFGGPWLALELIRRLQLDPFFERVLPQGREQVPWSLGALILVVARLLEPASKPYTAERWSPKTALPELLGVPVEPGDDKRLYGRTWIAVFWPLGAESGPAIDDRG